MRAVESWIVGLVALAVTGGVSPVHAGVGFDIDDTRPVYTSAIEVPGPLTLAVARDPLNGQVAVTWFPTWPADLFPKSLLPASCSEGQCVPGGYLVTHADPGSPDLWEDTSCVPIGGPDSAPGRYCEALPDNVLLRSEAVFTLPSGDKYVTAPSRTVHLSSVYPWGWDYAARVDEAQQQVADSNMDGLSYWDGSAGLDRWGKLLGGPGEPFPTDAIPVLSDAILSGDSSQGIVTSGSSTSAQVEVPARPDLNLGVMRVQKLNADGSSPSITPKWENATCSLSYRTDLVSAPVTQGAVGESSLPGLPVIKFMQGQQNIGAPSRGFLSWMQSANLVFTGLVARWLYQQFTHGDASSGNQNSSPSEQSALLQELRQAGLGPEADPNRDAFRELYQGYADHLRFLSRYRPDQNDTANLAQQRVATATSVLETAMSGSGISEDQVIQVAAASGSNTPQWIIGALRIYFARNNEPGWTSRLAATIRPHRLPGVDDEDLDRMEDTQDPRAIRQVLSALLAAAGINVVADSDVQDQVAIALSQADSSLTTQTQVMASRGSDLATGSERASQIVIPHRNAGNAGGPRLSAARVPGQTFTEVTVNAGVLNGLHPDWVTVQRSIDEGPWRTVYESGLAQGVAFPTDSDIRFSDFPNLNREGPGVSAPLRLRYRALATYMHPNPSVDDSVSGQRLRILQDVQQNGELETYLEQTRRGLRNGQLTTINVISSPSDQIMLNVPERIRFTAVAMPQSNVPDSVGALEFRVPRSHELNTLSLSYLEGSSALSFNEHAFNAAETPGGAFTPLQTHRISIDRITRSQTADDSNHVTYRVVITTEDLLDAMNERYFGTVHTAVLALPTSNSLEVTSTVRIPEPASLAAGGQGLFPIGRPVRTWIGQQREVIGGEPYVTIFGAVADSRLVQHPAATVEYVVEVLNPTDMTWHRVDQAGEDHPTVINLQRRTPDTPNGHLTVTIALGDLLAPVTDDLLGMPVTTMVNTRLRARITDVNGNTYLSPATHYAISPFLERQAEPVTAMPSQGQGGGTVNDTRDYFNPIQGQGGTGSQVRDDTVNRLGRQLTVLKPESRIGPALKSGVTVTQQEETSSPIENIVGDELMMKSLVLAESLTARTGATWELQPVGRSASPWDVVYDCRGLAPGTPYLLHLPDPSDSSKTLKVPFVTSVGEGLPSFSYLPALAPDVDDFATSHLSGEGDVAARLQVKDGNATYRLWHINSWNNEYSLCPDRGIPDVNNVIACSFKASKEGGYFLRVQKLATGPEKDTAAWSNYTDLIPVDPPFEEPHPYEKLAVDEIGTHQGAEAGSTAATVIWKGGIGPFKVTMFNPASEKSTTCIAETNMNWAICDGINPNKAQQIKVTDIGRESIPGYPGLGHVTSCVGLCEKRNLSETSPETQDVNAPQNIRVTPGSHNATITWSTAADNQTHHTVTLTQLNNVDPNDHATGNSVTQQTIVPANNQSLTLFGLQANTQYKVSVTAHRNEKQAPSSGHHFQTLIGAPEKPTIKTTETVDASSNMSLTWEQPHHDGGSPVTGYTLKCTTNLFGEKSFTKEYPADARTAAFTAITPGYLHNCALTARNTLGASPQSTVDISASTKPSTPHGLSVIKATRICIFGKCWTLPYATVTWKNPTYSGHPAPLMLNYQIQTSTDQGKTWKTMLTPTGPITSTLVDNQTGSLVRVRAVNFNLQASDWTSPAAVR